MSFVLVENGIVVQKQPNPHDGFIEAPDDVVCGYFFDGEGFNAPSVAVEQPYTLYKSTFIERMSVDQAATFETLLNAHELAKLRLMYHAVEYFISDDPLFAVLHWGLVQEFGETRADELLANPLGEP